MRKLKKIIGISIGVLLVAFTLYYIGFLAPYNLQGLLIANNLRNIPEVSEYFKNHNVSKIMYLGNNAYEVFTDRDNFIILTDYSDYLFWKYKIFKFDKEIKYFTNPM